jgi:hypothetical protein
MLLLIIELCPDPKTPENEGDQGEKQNKYYARRIAALATACLLMGEGFWFRRRIAKFVMALCPVMHLPAHRSKVTFVPTASRDRCVHFYPTGMEDVSGKTHLGAVVVVDAFLADTLFESAFVAYRRYHLEYNDHTFALVVIAVGFV